ncbi:NAD(P)-binding protein [Gymnopus androsaceus JB14]|uniref:NAD(P)-binding protein n=1 Tax=Gymnopus androsaceus JB14 TaxID=1447944 RepID=A0A6A4IG10_9AGAR|nr:NAD(P)-binding protein [Gymnopus androsaceus JB14]
MPDIYLVIGSNALGRHIAKKLIARGDVVAVLDNEQHFDDGIPFHSAGTIEYSAVLSVLKKTGATCVFHTRMATLGENLPKIEADEKRWKINVEGVRNVVSACVDAKVAKLIYMSSADIIFTGQPINGADETYPLPKKGYQTQQETVLVAEKMVLDANGQQGLLTCALRPSHIFGAGLLRDSRPPALLLNLYKQYQEGKTGYQIGDNKSLVDFTSVQNLADAHILAADYLASPLNPKHPVASFLHYKWAKKEPVVISRWLALAIVTAKDIGGRITGEPVKTSRQGIVMATTSRWYDISKAKEALGYSPKVSMEEEMDNMVEWFMKDFLDTQEGSGWEDWDPKWENSEPKNSRF